jgi:hypothetical protein
VQYIREFTRTTFFATGFRLTCLPHRASLCSLRSSLAPLAPELVCARGSGRSSCSYRDMFREKRLDVTFKVGKAGHSSRRPFSRKICVLPQATGWSRAFYGRRAKVTGLVFVADSCRISFSVKGEHDGRLCLFMQTQPGPDFLSPIILAC